MRSSTNAEDLPSFSGAGLYSSYGAQLGTSDPPSKRVCKTWASVWNWQAFEERAFWNIDHMAVRMGVAVHQAFPDEQANGVLITQNIGDPLTRGIYVNAQLGETSVTNPVGGAIPEIFVITPGPTGVQVARLRFSSLSPDAPLLSDDEVRALYQAATTTQQHFAPLYDEPADLLALDIEWKLHGPERALFFKQVRPYRSE
ncbi:MAG: PEP/pyruvate-binding domain-containing protein [Myxococcota bacterium]